MNKKSKITLAATASVAAAALAFALPSAAHDQQGPEGSGTQPAHERGQQGPKNIITLDGSITDIPAEVTNLRDAVMGANFEVFVLDESATVVPAIKPSEDAKIIGIRPVRIDGEMVKPEITNGQVDAAVNFRAPATEGVVKLGVYPSDDSTPILVTITTDEAGESTVTSSGDLSVSYEEAVAAENQDRFEARAGQKGKGMGHGRSQHSKDHAPGTES